MSAAGPTVTEQAEPIPLAETYPIAELERRFYAFFIDRLIGWTLVAVVGLGARLVLDDVWAAVAVGAGVMALSWLVIAVVVGVSGNTPGKAMVGLRVVHHGTGTPIGVGRSLLRSLVLAPASAPTFALGLATTAWTAVEDRGRQRRGMARPRRALRRRRRPAHGCLRRRGG
ncbi:RDD family protein [Nocardioides sp. B-3]|uniref:RDD family protein n=1 Tax=Nocardioides sp. B-3 TaxID=2895565 RepID=UPI0021530DC5|nr:RDD family protein [Nocardioides sp. B-3]UUZ57813.1 RDD family protein [Nocardioides sp. B-3]